MIKGRKVIIRPKKISDAADDYTWRRDEELSRLDASQMLQIPFSSFLLDYADDIGRDGPRRRRYGIDTLDGKHIGNSMFYNIDTHKKEAELGIMIGDRDYWDNGYGTNAVETMVDHMFKTMSIDRIYLNTLEWNLRAQRCFGKCGFVPYKRLKRFGHNFVAMEMFRSQWKPAETLSAECESRSTKNT